jgi:ATP-dependent protease Clp ATPase subunit
MGDKIKVVELFAGVGGFRLGLEGWNGKSPSSGYQKKMKSNYEIVWSNQWEPSTKIQHASNCYINRFGADGHSNKNISDVNLEEIPAHDLLAGGFPCQDYSVAKQLNVPFAAGDATVYSPTGFQGADVDAVIHDLFTKSNGDIDMIEQGVVFIDEIDKLASFHSHGTRTEALHTATQSSMLKLIEGKSVKLPQSLTGREGPPYTVDTNKILFCFGGAFNGLHEIVGKKLGYKGPKVSLKKDEGDVFEEQIKSFEIYQQASHEIIVESLIEYGLSTELVGRIQTIVALAPLKYEELKTCLLDLRSSPIANQALLFAESGYEIIFTDEFIDQTIKRVMKTGTGTRALGSMVKKAVSQAAFDLLGNFNDSGEQVIIDSSCLDSPSKYLLDKGTCSLDL